MHSHPAPFFESNGGYNATGLFSHGDHQNAMEWIEEFNENSPQVRYQAFMLPLYDEFQGEQPIVEWIQP